MKKVIIAIVAALVLTGVGVILFFVLRGGDEEKHTDRGDRADIADIADKEDKEDKEDKDDNDDNDKDDLALIINGGTQDNTKDESITDVIVTVNGGTELNLTGDVGEVIRKVNESNGYVFHGLTLGVLNTDESGEIVAYPNKGLNNMPLKDYFLSITAYLSNSGFRSQLDDESLPAYISYVFHEGEEKDNYNKWIIEGLSFSNSWNGELSEIGKLLNEENSIIDTSSKTVNVGAALFKNGKICTIDEITSEYGDEAIKLIKFISEYCKERGMKQINDLYLSYIFQDYYMETRNWESEEAKKYMQGATYNLNRWFRHVIGMGQSKLIIDEENLYESEFYNPIVAMFSFYVAMNDWAAKKDDSIKNYGIIAWNWDGQKNLEINVHCTGEDYNRINNYRIIKSD